MVDDDDGGRRRRLHRKGIVLRILIPYPFCPTGHFLSECLSVVRSDHSKHHITPRAHAGGGPHLLPCERVLFRRNLVSLRRRTDLPTSLAERASANPFRLTPSCTFFPAHLRPQRHHQTLQSVFVRGRLQTVEQARLSEDATPSAHRQEKTDRESLEPL